MVKSGIILACSAAALMIPQAQAMHNLHTHLATNRIVDRKLLVNNDTENLVMAYIPYNFGHTVALKAMENGIEWGDCGERIDEGIPYSGTCLGHQTNEATGCENMYTPGKYWPSDLAEEYFGDKQIFGLLRDPYERMVAQFRGSGASMYPELHAACDINNGVKQMMRDIMASDQFAANCNHLPQAEFFDQPFGATIASDVRFFPDDMNDLLESKGLSALHIADEEVDHITGCNDHWAGDLDCEARGLVYQYYQRDFELICKELGHCDLDENVCLTRVEEMCPTTLFAWDAENWEFEPISDSQLMSFQSTHCTIQDLSEAK